MSPPLIVIATFTPKPEHYDEVKKVLLECDVEVREMYGVVDSSYPESL